MESLGARSSFILWQSMGFCYVKATPLGDVTFVLRRGAMVLMLPAPRHYMSSKEDN